MVLDVRQFKGQPQKCCIQITRKIPNGIMDRFFSTVLEQGTYSSNASMPPIKFQLNLNSSGGHVKNVKINTY